MQKRGTPNEELNALKKDGAGMRRLLIDDMREERADAPRPLSRNLEGYMEGAAARPVFGLHKAARLSEHYMYRTHFGRKASTRRFAGAAEAFFFDVRQTISTLLHNWRGGPLPAGKREKLRQAIARFDRDAKGIEAALGSVRRCACPCCRGTARIFGDAKSAAVVKAILDEAVKAGRLAYDGFAGYYVP